MTACLRAARLRAYREGGEVYVDRLYGYVTRKSEYGVSWKHSVGCDVYVRYVLKNDTNGGQDVSFVRLILAVSSCLWLECQFVFLRGPYVTQCAEMTRGYIVRGSLGCVLRLYGVGAATWICGQRLTSEQT